MPTALELFSSRLKGFTNPEIFQTLNRCTRNGQNVSAMLEVIRYAEGTDGADGYNKLFGGGTFTSFAKHPNVYNSQFDTTAAGAFQITKTTYDWRKLLVNVKDFSPASQRLIAQSLLAYRNAFSLVQQGYIREAIPKLRSEWTSLPGASQSRTSMDEVIAVFESKGGTMA